VEVALDQVVVDVHVQPACASSMAELNFEWGVDWIRQISNKKLEIGEIGNSHLVGLPVAPRHGNGGGEEGIPAGRR
jgi:hypothetical protein